MGILNKLKKTDSKVKTTKKDVDIAEGKEIAKTTVLKKVVKISTEGKDVIIKPLVTEKTAILASSGKYVFVVRSDAGRIEIKNAIKKMFGVSPISVNIQNVKGKSVRFGRRIGRRSDWKKAIVSLKEGETINVYEGV